MQAERDHLVRFVFPKLREELLKRRIHFVDVDLRWGVTLDQDAVGVCKKIIDECRPRFICILGGRYGWVPEGKQQSITAQEVQYAAIDRPDVEEYRYFYFRDRAVTATMEESEPGEFRESDDSENAKKLAELKKSVVAAGFDTCIYRARWDAKLGRLVDLQEFGEMVYRDLLASIEDEFPPAEEEELPAADEFADANSAMEAFIQERTQRYVLGSRSKLLSRMLEFAQGDGEPSVFVLTGEPGSGKSALLAKFCQEHASRHQDDVVVSHFIGAGPGTTDLRRILRRLCHELASATGDETEVPQDVKELVKQFPDFLRKVANERRVVLVIDALDQLDATDNAQSMYWLPRDLPENVRVVTSSLEHAALDALKLRKEQVVLKNLQPLAQEDSRAIVNEFLSRYQKRMSQEQVDALLAKPDSSTPLYLLAALEELRTLGTYEEMTGRIRELPGEAAGLFHWILTERLSKDPGFRDAEGVSVGEGLVRRFVSYIGVSRYGMSHSELVELIDPGDPRGNVAALERLLRPYLMLRGELLSFYHRQFREAVLQEYLDEEQERLDAHRVLADFFRHKADPEGDSSWTGNHVRALSELPYHQTQGQMWDRVKQTLCDLRFVEAKVAVGSSHSLVTDYNAALSQLPEVESEMVQKRENQARVQEHVRSLMAYARGETETLDVLPSSGPSDHGGLQADTDRPSSIERVRGFSQFVSAEVQTLNRLFDQRGIVLQQAYNSANGGPVARAAGRFLRSSRAGPVLLKLKPCRPQHTAHAALTKTLGQSEGSVTALAVSPDGRLAVSGRRTLQVWDLEAGVRIRELQGHRFGASAVALTPDSRLAVSAGFDRTIRVWDLPTGMCLKTLDFHTGWIGALAVTPDGRLAATGSYGGDVRVWDLEQEAVVWSPTEHQGEVRAIAITPRGREVVAGSSDFRMRIVNPSTGECLRTLGVPSRFADVAHARRLIPGGRVVFGGWRIRTWDVASRRCLRSLCQHGSPLGALAFSLDARTAISGSWDMQVWDLTTGTCKKTIEEHRGIARALAVTADARTAVAAIEDTIHRVSYGKSCSREISLGERRGEANGVFSSAPGARTKSRSRFHALRVWDTASGMCVKSFEGLRGGTGAIAVTPDGRQAVSQCRGLSLWDLERGQSTQPPSGHYDTVTCLAVSRDGRIAVSGGSDCRLLAWDVNSGKRLASLEGHRSTVDSVAVDPTGRLAISSGGDSRFWLLREAKCLKFARTRRAVGDSLAVTPDGRAVVAGGRDGLLIRDLATGRIRKFLKGQGVAAKLLALSPDGRLAFTAGVLGPPLIWDLGSGSCELVPGAPADGTRAVAVSPDGRCLVAGGYDGYIRFLDIRARTWTKSVEQHRGAVNAMDVTPDGHAAITAGSDHTLRVWDVKTASCLRVLRGHESSVEACAASPDGHRIASGSTGGTLRMWDLRTGDCTHVADLNGGRVFQVAMSTRRVVAGLESGKVEFLTLGRRRLTTKRPFATPVRLWHVGKPGSVSRWGTRLTACCSWCGRRFRTGSQSTQRVKVCPSSDCCRPLRLNPFVVDNRRRPQ